MQIRVTRQKLSPAAIRALTHIEEFDWIIFTSKNAVVFFIQELRERGIEIPKKSSVRIAAVGPETATALKKVPLAVRFVPKFFTVLDLVQSIPTLEGRRILFPRSANASKEAIQTLRARGARVRVLPLYTTAAVALSRPIKKALVSGEYTKLVFTSPSGVMGLMRQLTTSEQKIAQVIPVQCIGPTTAATARAAGFKKVTIRGILKP
jgi:uroporphyrinogen III methyltransferase / synthase